MAKDNTSEVLSPTNNATYQVVNGVKYFKLVSEFPGDYTKNCGLLGNEIDENFYFLRGYDIKDVAFDEDTKILTITRVDSDYEPMEVNIGWAIASDRPTFVFDRETGKLTITYGDGTQEVVEGFMVEGSEDISIGTDSTLRGKGTMYNPLGLSYTERTGTYAPAFDYFDISDSESDDFGQMPTPMGKGYRVVTKELFNGFGYLYPYSAVERIAEALAEKNSPWRIPTKEDWDEMLNAMECPEDRNHSAYTSTFLGRKAGSALKSPGYYEEDESGNVITHTGVWKYFPVPDGEDEVFGQDLKGFTAFPVGYSENRNSFMNNNDNDVEGFRLATAFWTSTTDPANGQIYGKIFGHNSSRVYQQSFDDDSKLSIRLVKDYDLTNFEEYENILGLYYPTKLITGVYDDLKYSKIWTTINFYGDKDDLGGVSSDEWSGVTSDDASVKTVYFICEYDGEKWHKKQMSEGDSVVILNKDGEENYHEWRIIHGELVDTLEQTYEEFNADFAEIREGLSGLSASTVELSASVVSEIERLDESISTETTRATEAEQALSGRIDIISGDVSTLSSSTVTEIERINENITEIRETVSAFSSSVISEIERVETLIADESVRATEAEQALSDGLDELSGSVETLSGATVDEVARAMAAEEELGDRLDAEETDRENGDMALGDYTLTQEGTTLLTNAGGEVKIIVDADFFNFGTIV